MGFYDILRHWADITPTKIFLQVDHLHYSYEKFLALVDQIGQSYAESLPTPLTEQIVIIQEKDFALQVAHWLGVLKIGACPIVCHTDMSEERLAKMRERYHLNSPRSLIPVPEQATFGVLSSGSTGIPKVLWRNSKSWENFFPIQNKVFHVDKGTKLFLHGSFSFTGNANSLLSVLFEGGTIITSNKFRPLTWLNLCRKFSVSHLYVLPTKLRLFLRYMEQENQGIPQLRMIFTGSQLLDQKLMEGLRKWQPNTDFILYYGASELNYITWCTYDEWLKEPNIVGKPFPGVSVTIKDKLVYVDSPYGIEGITLPYSVGDRGHFTSSGMLLFEGRQGAIINRAGYKIGISGLEEILVSLDGVLEAVVMAIPDELRGEEAVAFLVLQEDTPMKKIKKALQKEILPNEMPHIILAVPYIPLNSCSKVDKGKLQEWLTMI